MILDSIENDDDNLYDHFKNKIIAFMTSLVFKHYKLLYNNLLISAFRGSCYNISSLNDLLINVNKLNIYLSDHDFLTNKKQLYKFIDNNNNKISVINTNGYHGNGLYNYYNLT